MNESVKKVFCPVQKSVLRTPMLVFRGPPVDNLWRRERFGDYVLSEVFFCLFSDNVPDYESRRRASLIVPSEKNLETEEIKKNDPGKLEHISIARFILILPFEVPHSTKSKP